MGEACCGTCEMFAGKEPEPLPEQPAIEGGVDQFKILIYEKGGEAREYVPSKPDIIIGRVSSNDIVLPKGNVDKRASAIHFRDGNVIVNDMKSTCGTYVNGRKITAPIRVTESAKIYIGDFVLQVVRR